MKFSSYLRSPWNKRGRSGRRAELSADERRLTGFNERLESAARSSIETLERRTLLSTYFWTGLGTDNNWSTPGNWQGGAAPGAGASLVFAGTTRTTPNDDLVAGTGFTSIAFNSSGFTLTGNQINLSGGVTVASGVSTASVTPPVSLSAAQSFTVPPGGSLTIGGVISGNGAMTKSGAGTLILSGNETNTGTLTVAAGTLQVGNGGSSGSLAGAITLAGGALEYDWNVFGAPAPNITLTASSSLGTIGQQVNLGVTLNGGGYQLNINGGSAQPIYLNNTCSNISQINILTGSSLGTDLHTGTGNQLGTSFPIINVGSGATFQTYDAGPFYNQINLNGGNGNDGTGELLNSGHGTATLRGTITLAAGVSSIGTNGANINITGNVTGSGGLGILGTGIVTLSGTNSYTGGTTVTSGTLQAGNGGSTGAIPANNITLAGGTLQYDLNAFATPSLNINLTANSTIGTIGQQVNVGGTLSGGGYQLSVNDGAGTLPLYLNDTVSNVSQFNVLAGALGFDFLWGNQGGTNLPPIVVASGATFETYDSGTLANNITLNAGTGVAGLGELANQGNGNASFTGQVTVPGGIAAIGTASGNITTNGAITGAGGVNKIGTNTLTLTGSSSYTAGTTVSAGVLVVTNTTGSATGTGSVTIASGATLSGTGTISGTVTVNSGGYLSPGNPSTSTGKLAVGTLNLAAGSTLVANINSNSAGAGYDLVTAGGAISISSTSHLSVVSGSITSVSGTALTLLSSAASTVQGSFANAAEGTTFTLNGVGYVATYLSGNSFSLVNTTPAASLSGPTLVGKAAEIPLNSNHDLGNVDASGQPLQDNDFDYSTGSPVRRIRVGSGPIDPDLTSLNLQLNGVGTSTYTITVPSDLFVWNISNPLNPVMVTSGQSVSVNVPAAGLTVPLMVEGEQLSYTSTNQNVVVSYVPHGQTTAITDSVNFKVIGVALYIDADNNNGFGVPDGSNVEGADKQNPNATGKIITAATGDSDGDGIPDFADGYNLDGITGNADDSAGTDVRFVPLFIQMFQPVDFAHATIRFDYSGSDPMAATTTTPAPGYLRLWLKDGSTQRNGHGVGTSGGGDYIVPGVTYLASQLGFTGVLTNGYQDVEIYAEGIRPVGVSDDADRQISMTVDPDGSGSFPVLKPARVDVTVIAPQPTGPISLAASVSGADVDLAWTYDANDQTSFVIQRALDNQFQTGLLTIPVADWQARSFIDAPAPGTTYYYEIAPVDQSTVGTFSNVVTAVLPSGTAPVTFTNDGPANKGSPVDFTFAGAPAGSTYSYDFNNDGLFTGTGDAAQIASSTDSFTFANAGTYTVHGEVTDSTGSNTNYFSTVVVIDNTPPTAPSSLTATAASDSEIDLQWHDNSSNEAGFVVLRSPSYYGPYSPIYTSGANVTTFPDTGLAECTGYYYEVFAENSAGNSSATYPAYAQTFPSAPTGLSATLLSTTQIQLAWTDNSALASSYYVYQSTDGINWNTSYYAGNGGTTSYTLNGTFDTPNTFYFKVEADGGNSFSIPSNIVSTSTSPAIVTPASANPSPVTGTTATLSVLGTMPDGTDTLLNYTWFLTSSPAGGIAAFSANGTNAAKTDLATFNEAGVYTFSVNANFGRLIASSQVSVLVEQSVTTITIAPPNTTILTTTTQQLSATATDQFGNNMVPEPSFDWSVEDSSLGTIDDNGLFSAGSDYGPETIEAAAGGVSGSTLLTLSPVNQNEPLEAVALDTTDIALYWLDLPALAQGQTLEMSQDPSFATGVTQFSVPVHTTDFEATGLTPNTTYNFELFAVNATTPIASASATTSDVPTDGSNPPTAPVTTQQATETEISPTSYNLQMQATSDDPLSYDWQLISSTGPEPSFENDDSVEDSVVIDVSAPGTYVYLATVTDTSNSLSVPSDVTVTVEQTATTIKVSPGVTQLASGGTLQFTASELDQFGQPMNPQPSFSWSVSDTTLGSIDGSGNFTASNTNIGNTNVSAAADNLTGMSAVIVQQPTTINFTSLPVGTVVTDQFPGVTFSSPQGYTDKVFNDPPNRLGVYSGSFLALGQELDVTFLNPVSNLKYVAGFFDSAAGTVVGTVEVYTGGTLAGTVNVVSPGPYTNGTVNLSAYSGVTKIVIGQNTDPAGLGYTSFSYIPQSLALVAVDKSDSNNFQISSGSSSDGNQPPDLYIGSVPDGSAQVQLFAPDGAGNLSNPDVTWTITPVGAGSSATPSSGTFANGPVTVTLDYNTTNYLVTATDANGNTVTIDLHNVHITAYKEVVSGASPNVPGGGNAVGAELTQAQAAIGTYIPFDTLDEDYDGNPDFLETTGQGGVIQGAVQGDTLMSEITLPSLSAGFYELHIPSGFSLFSDKLGSASVGITKGDSSTDSWLSAANGGNNITLWIEGTGRDIGNGNWQGDNIGKFFLYWNQTKTEVGRVSLNKVGFTVHSFTWTGSQDVPGNTTYAYNVTGATKGSGWASVSGGKSTIAKGANTANATIKWDDGPVFGEAVYKVNDAYSWEFTVNVVQVDLSSATSNKITLTTSKPGMPLLGKGFSQPLIESIDPSGNNNGPAMQASVSLMPIVGPVSPNDPTNTMRGVKWIEAGYIQSIQIEQDSGTYVYTDAINPNNNASSTVSSSLQGNKVYVDGDNSIPKSYPWFDYGNKTNTNVAAGMQPSLSSTAFAAYYTSPTLVPNAPKGSPNFSESANSATSVTLTTDDNPKLLGGPSIFWNPKVGATEYLNSVNIMANYVLYVAVASTKAANPSVTKNVPGNTDVDGNMNDDIYTAIAKASWYFNGSGKITGATAAVLGTSYTPSASAGTGAGTADNPNGTSAVFVGASGIFSGHPTQQNINNGTTVFANTLLSNMTWASK